MKDFRDNEGRPRVSAERQLLIDLSKTFGCVKEEKSGIAPTKQDQLIRIEND